jgi:hypothetical protein
VGAMTIEEVIAIAKTLRPGFFQAEEVKIYRLRKDTLLTQIVYVLVYLVDGNRDNFEGDSWEEALRFAGWKG